MKIKLLLPLVLALLIEVGHAHERENPEPFFEKVDPYLLLTLKTIFYIALVCRWE